ncbi:MAG: TolC family protein [Allosphingosinicella sp.]|uniref:TolC family protein n=1 Tax=Allosphingosinicella sp. TaxID=2823234 RepID=UPI003953DB43
MQSSTGSGVRSAAGARLPAVEASSTSELSRLSINDPQVAGLRAAPDFDRVQDRYSVGLAASWEVDLFGRLGARVRAARADADARRHAVEAARLAVTTELAQRYMMLRLLQQRRAVAARRVEALAALAHLSALRVARGVSPPVERDSLAAEASSARAAVPALTAEIEEQFARIDVLAGREVGTARQSLAAIADIPGSAPIDLASLPAELLRRRPDVLMAEAELAGRDARVAAAIADRLPRLDLAALFGFLAGAINPLVGAGALTAGGSAGLSYNIFDGGRSRAAVDAAKADMRGAIATYERTLLDAAADVQTASAAQVSAHERVRALQDAEGRLGAVLAAVEQARHQGTSSLTDVLDVDRRLQDARDARLVAEAEQALALIAIVRALGGYGAKVE